MADRYKIAGDLPYRTVAAANTMDHSARELPEDDRLPVGVETRWQATVRLIQDLEERRDIDVLHVLLSLSAASQLTTEDITRAIEREAKIMRSNQDSDRPGGRPSKVDSLVQSIESSCAIADRGGYETSSDQIAARNRQIRQTLREADISRRTFYRVRDRIKESQGIDLSEIISPSDVLI